MSIQINSERCVGCGCCAEVCPGTLISLTEGRVRMDYPRDCWGCASCIKECPNGAIEFFLGADIGGNGSVMNVEHRGKVMRWKIRKCDGTEVVIDVNPKDANAY
ncbi:MAG: ferredoxin family protein [Clostridiales bacterium]|nr:ferredoxin family protein [Clostridiales bacterium]